MTDIKPITSGGSFRWTICALLFLATTVNYMDRQIISVLKPYLMSQDNGLSIKQDQFAVLKPVIEKGEVFSVEQRTALAPLLALPTDGVAVTDKQLAVIKTLADAPASVGLTVEQAAVLASAQTTPAGNRYLTPAQLAVLKPVIEADQKAEKPAYPDLKGLLKAPKANVYLTKDQTTVVESVIDLPAAKLGVSAEQADKLVAIRNNPRDGIGMTEEQYSYVIIAFQAAYALGLLIFGRLIDRFGTKLSYAGSIVFWSLSSAAHALASGVFGFAAARFALGVGEAGNFPAANKTTAEWFPKRERALVVSIFNSGTNIGAMVAPFIIVWIAITFSWRVAFLANGVLAAAWLILWFLFYHKPTESRFVGEAEKKWINQDDGAQEQRTEPVPWSTLLKFPQTWAFAAAKFGTDAIWWFFLFWLPGWLVDSKGIDIKASTWLLFIIYLMATVGSIMIAGLSSRLIARGFATNTARKVAMLLCALLVLPILFAVKADHQLVAVLLVGLAAAAHQGWSANLFSTVSDMFPKRAVASVTGIGGMAGSLGSMIFAYAVGQILAAGGGYWIPFTISASAYLISLAFFHLLAPKMTPVNID
jgi:ACS family hexuronate transporter-like MFS transporter